MLSIYAQKLVVYFKRKREWRDMILTQHFELSSEMGLVEERREIPPQSSCTVQPTEDTPQSPEDDDSQWEPKEEPLAEANGPRLREVALPHAHQYQVYTCPRQRAHPTDGG